MLMNAAHDLGLNLSSLVLFMSLNNWRCIRGSVDMVRTSDMGERLRVSSKDMSRALQQEPGSVGGGNFLGTGNGSIPEDPHLGEVLPR